VCFPPIEVFNEFIHARDLARMPRPLGPTPLDEIGERFALATPNSVPAGEGCVGAHCPPVNFNGDRDVPEICP